MHGRALVGRTHRIRTLGHALGAWPVAAVLYENDGSVWAWLALFASGYLWPHAAWLLARRAGDAKQAELRNLYVDSAIGGAWIAAMQFNLLPSALMLVVLSIDKISLGGWRLLGRNAAMLAVACAAVSALLGFPLRIDTSMFVIAMSLPFLLVYPLALSTMLHSLNMRVRKQNRLLERLNRIDALTGLHNRRHWEDVVGHELARHQRLRRPAMVLLIDVDNFKQVNDNHGHATGDEVLRCIAEVLRAVVRDIDTPARYGGDEFAVLLTETDLAGAMAVVERIRDVFQQTRGAQAEHERCTLSIGLAAADRTLVTVDDWVRRADAAMYIAKGAGRDRVEVA